MSMQVANPHCPLADPLLKLDRLYIEDLPQTWLADIALICQHERWSPMASV